MTKEIVTRDDRLFLFQVLECGLKKKRINESFVDKFKKDGTQMAFVFAKRYYSVVYESYLRQASHCVLGVMNIGLIESSGNHLEGAVKILFQKGCVGIFREGWSRILDLVHQAGKTGKFRCKTMFEWERDFAESFSAEPGREWIGHDEYLINKVMYYDNYRGRNGTS